MASSPLRYVRVKATITYEVPAPARAADKESVEFQRNDGSWCASNMIQELEELDIDTPDEQSCLCPLVHFEFVEAVGEEFESGDWPPARRPQ